MLTALFCFAWYLLNVLCPGNTSDRHRGGRHRPEGLRSAVRWRHTIGEGVGALHNLCRDYSNLLHILCYT